MPPAPFLGGAGDVLVRRHSLHHRDATLVSELRRVRGRARRVRGGVHGVRVGRGGDRGGVGAGDVAGDGVRGVVGGDKGGGEDGADGADGGGVLHGGVLLHAAAGVDTGVGGGAAADTGGGADDEGGGGGGLGGYAAGDSGVYDPDFDASDLFHCLWFDRWDWNIYCVPFWGLDWGFLAQI